MSKLQELIKELCPDGVEFRKLGECLYSIKTGLNPRHFFVLNSPDAKNFYVTIREIKGGNLVFTEKTDRINDEALGLCNNRSDLEIGDVLFSGTGTIGEIYVIETTPHNWNIKEGVYSLKPKKDVLIPKYLKYILDSRDIKNKYLAMAEGGTVKSVSMKLLASLEIPLPPLEVQNEIVRILDTFTSHAAELQAELQARKEQYEYYRNKLLTFDENDEGVKWMKLGEIGTFVRGNGLQKKDFTETGFPCIHYGQIHTYYCTATNSTISYTSNSLAEKLRKASYGDLIIATTSEDVDCVCKACTWLGENDVAISGDSYVFRHNQNPKYVSYLFQTKLFYEFKKKAATGTKVIRVSGESMEKFLLPFPPLSEQQRIVSILDKFESLVNDLTAGLPAEIAAVQEQYEYYRNKLLSFKRI